MKEGVTARYARHAEMTDMVHKWSKKHFGLYAEQGFRSKTLTAVETGKFDFEAFDKALKAKGFEISNGYGKIKDNTFRIGHMGDLVPKDINDLTKVMDEVLEEMK